MKRQSKWEYMKAIYDRYYKASKAIKRIILDEFCEVCGYHRKHAIRKLNTPLTKETSKSSSRGRKPVYGSDIISILQAVWGAADYPWSTRLKVILVLWMPWIRKRYRLTPEQERQLLGISPRTIDYRLKDKKTQLRRRIYGRTKPGTLLKHHIPIKTDCWDVKVPGFTEIDLVSHSGNSADGEFIHSLNETDILTTWTETRAVMSKGQAGVRKALDEMRQVSPFDWLGIDSDNGSEFINAHLLHYCQTPPQLQFTRGRPYKKDDNAHIEQKNDTHVRRLLGYERYDSLQALEAINDLYRNELRLMKNLLQPSVKLVKKVRVGSRRVRKYDKPQTPLDRLIASGKGNLSKVAELKQLRKTLDPFELARTIKCKLDVIYNLANRRLSPRSRMIDKEKINALLEVPVLSTAQQNILRSLSKDLGIETLQCLKTNEKNKKVALKSSVAD